MTMYFQVKEVSPLNHEAFMEWWVTKGKASPMGLMSTPSDPCPYCRCTWEHEMSPCFDERTGKIFGFMCGSIHPFPTPGDA